MILDYEIHKIIKNALATALDGIAFDVASEYARRLGIEGSPSIEFTDAVEVEIIKACERIGRSGTFPT